MQMENVTVAISLANLLVLLAMAFKVGGFYRRFQELEKKVQDTSKRLPHLVRLVQRIADKLGLTHEASALSDMSGD